MGIGAYIVVLVFRWIIYCPPFIPDEPVRAKSVTEWVCR